MSHAILAASYLGPEGHGNDRTGLRPWAPDLADALARGELGAFHWSHLFPSDPARFERMDLMCRFGLAAVELLDAGLDSMSAAARDRTGVCVQTRAGSIAVDLEFLRTPRASLFAYTLPSAVVGEICIRYRLRGPILCVIPGLRDNGLEAASAWLDDGDADACVCLSCDAAGPGDSARAGIPAGWRCAALLLGKSGEDARPGIPLSRLAFPDRRHWACAGLLEVTRPV